MGLVVVKSLLVSGLAGFSATSYPVYGEALDERCVAFWGTVSFEDIQKAPNEYLARWQKLKPLCQTGNGYYERNLGYIHLAALAFTEAETAFESAAKIDMRYLNDLAQLYITQSQYTEDQRVERELLEQSQAVLLDIVRLDQQHHAVYFSLGTTAFLSGNHVDAVNYLNQSIALQPNSESLALLGRAYFNLTQYEAASHAILKAFELDKSVVQDEDAMYVLAMSFVALNDYESAKTTLSLLSKARPDLMGTKTYQSVFNAIVEGFNAD